VAAGRVALGLTAALAWPSVPARPCVGAADDHCSVVLLGVSTASARLCGPVNAVHSSGLALSRARTCQPSPPVPTPRRGP
jgi:hypothetical protein